MSGKKRKIYQTCQRCNGAGTVTHAIISIDGTGKESKVGDEVVTCDNCYGEQIIEFGYIQFKAGDFPGND